MTASPPADPVRPLPASSRVSFAGLAAGEVRKLKGSLVMVLSAAVPGLVLLMGFLMGMMEDVTAMRIGGGTVAMWGQVLLPLGVLALTVVLAQLEHQPRGWDPLLALPGARARLFLVKLAAAMLVVAGWHAILWAGLGALDLFFAHVMPGHLDGRIAMGWVAGRLARMCGAGALMAVVQYGLALYFRSFVPPLVLGFAGILASLMAYASKWGVLVPWMLPINQMASEAWRADLALGLGLGGGVVAAVVLQGLMQRREW